MCVPALLYGFGRRVLGIFLPGVAGLPGLTAGSGEARALILGQQGVVVVDTLLRDTGPREHPDGLADHRDRPGHVGLTFAVRQEACRDAADVPLHPVEHRVI